jgi:hypothetical protein
MRKHGFSASAVVACCLSLSGCDPHCKTLGTEFSGAKVHPRGVVKQSFKGTRVCCVKTGSVTITSKLGKTVTLQCHSQGITQV